VKQNLKQELHKNHLLIQTVIDVSKREDKFNLDKFLANRSLFVW